MVSNNTIPRGYRNETNLPKRNGVYMGLVRRNFDPQRMGRLQVWVSDFGPDESDYWMTVSYASPFAGASPVRDTKRDGQHMDDSQTTYGFWATPPDIDNQVLCCFLDGDIANGFWFSCIYPQNMNHMIPGIGSDISTDTAMNGQFSIGPPVVEYNKYDSANAPATATGTSVVTSAGAREQVKRPVFTPLAEALLRQGLAHDIKRGVSNTSARRESPSRAHGFLTPRGHSWQIDDGAVPEGGGEPEQEFIRLRTRSGVQLLINETDGFIYMITKGGKAWVEISDDGIDMYSGESISLNADKDINLHAGGKIGIHGTQSIELASAFYSSFTSGDTNIVSNANIYADATQDVGLKSSRDIAFDAVRDVSENAGRNIMAGACGFISRSAQMILDNSGTHAPVDVPHAHFSRNVITRLPTHEPWVRGDAHYDGVSGGNLTQQVRRSDGTTANEPVAPLTGITDDDLAWATVNQLEEAGNQGDEGMAAVTQVILNRLRTPSTAGLQYPAWRGRLKGVILAEHQFSWTWTHPSQGPNIPSRSFPAYEHYGQTRMAHWQAQPSVWAHARDIAQQVLSGSFTQGPGFQIVKNQNICYYANVGNSTASWVHQRAVACRIRAHTFFR